MSETIYSRGNLERLSKSQLINEIEVVVQKLKMVEEELEAAQKELEETNEELEATQERVAQVETEYGGARDCIASLEAAVVLLSRRVRPMSSVR